MSARAACRLAQLGFSAVYDFAPGKMAWLAAGRPVESDDASTRRAADVARRDVPVVHPDSTVGDARAALDGGAQLCIVTPRDSDVVIGVVRRDATELADATPIEDVLLPDPSTIRPYVSLPDALAEMEADGLTHLLVTTNEGRLVGVLWREDISQ
jgi:CBS domain-containing protein